VLLRRRGDLDLVMAQLGTLFATRGDVDKYFIPKHDNFELVASPEMDEFLTAAWKWFKDPTQPRPLLPGWEGRVSGRIALHMRSAPEREAAALQRWASGYCDGLDRALRIARHKE
jgi:hypothetical protein